MCVRRIIYCPSCRWPLTELCCPPLLHCCGVVYLCVCAIYAPQVCDCVTTSAASELLPDASEASHTQQQEN